MSLRYAVDTNVLLRLSNGIKPQRGAIEQTMDLLASRHVEFCFTRQNITEFWNVSTRPLERNGLGRSILKTEERVQSIQQTMTFLNDDERVYRAWRQIVLNHKVQGAQVHDAYLAATSEAHAVRHLLTFSGPDFKRFPSLTAVHPDDVHP
jgi:predicted nucleic acid-binding protein